MSKVKKTPYTDLCRNVYNRGRELIYEAVHPAFDKWVREDPLIQEYCSDQTELMEMANHAVRRVHPKLKASGAVIDATSVKYAPRWLRTIPSPWFCIFGHNTSVYLGDFGHAEIIHEDAGIFHPYLPNVHCDPNSTNHININTRSDMEWLPQHLIDKLEWADKQRHLLDEEFTKWTFQFKENLDPERRMLDVAFYFSPVFASFGHREVSPKVYSSRPRTHWSYIPMSKELAALLTMIRARREQQ
jgi:hypothetical protein